MDIKYLDLSISKCKLYLQVSLPQTDLFKSLFHNFSLMLSLFSPYSILVTPILAPWSQKPLPFIHFLLVSHLENFGPEKALWSLVEKHWSKLLCKRHDNSIYIVIFLSSCSLDKTHKAELLASLSIKGTRNRKLIANSKLIIQAILATLL